MILIRFKTEQDRIDGLYCLAINGWVRGIKGGIFEISDNHSKILDSADIAYEIIEKEGEILDACETIRNSLTAGI